MDLCLKNKVALVTGSSRGIGKSIAKKLSDEGCKVMLSARDSSSLESVKKEFGNNVDFFAGDVIDFDFCKLLVKQTIEKFGCLDILICNVGYSKSVKPGDENPEEWKKMFDFNFKSTTNMVEASKESLSKTNGIIVCISSIAGIETTGAPVTYSVAKASLNAYVRNISKPLGKLSVRINAVAPGNILFNGSVWDKKLQENETLVKEMLKREVSMERLGKPEEIVNFVIFLSSPLSSFATGQIYVVDGGQVRS